MHRKPFAAIALVMLIATGAAPQAPADSTWRDHRRAASAAIGHGDTAGYRMHTMALQRLVGTTPRIASGLATASFAIGDSAAGRRWTADFDAMTRPGAVVDRSTVAWRLDDADMIAEDFAYDAARRRLLVSSVRRGSIRAIDAAGRVTTFVPPGAAGVWGMFGLGIDSKRHALWATTAAFPGTANYTPPDSGKSALIEYDLNTGAIRRRIEAPDAGPHAFGDLAVGSDGSVYLGDGFGGGVYLLDPRAGSLRPLIPAGTFASTQTPALSADERTLYIADYMFGIAAIDVATGHWHWLRHSDSLALAGIDGLYRAGRDLVAVQNGIEPNRIMRLTLGSGDRIARATPIVRGGNGVDLNHAMVHDGQLWFIARSGWDRVADDGTMKPAAKGDGPVVRRVPI